MAGLFERLFGPKVDEDTMFALSWKMPTRLQVVINEDPSGMYVAKVHADSHHFKRPIVTQGSTGQELFEMVNDAVYTIVEIPEAYRQKMGVFLPPADVREEMSIKIPKKYLNTQIEAVRA